MPNSDWRTYVERYYPADDLEPTYDTGTSCGHVQIECSNDELLHSNFVRAEKRIGKQSRSVAVYPDCEPGITKIAWMVIEP